MPPKKSTTATPAAAPVVAPAPVVVSAPPEQSKSKEPENTDDDSSSSDEEDNDDDDFDTVVSLNHSNRMTINLTKNIKNVDYSDPEVRKAYRALRKSIISFMNSMDKVVDKYTETCAKTISKVENSEAKKEARKTARKKKSDADAESGESSDETPVKESGVNKPMDIPAPILTFMNQPPGTKLSRADLQRYFNEARTELNKFVMDAENKPMKGKPFYINEGRIGDFMNVIVKSIKDRGLEEAAKKKGVLDASGNPPAYVQHTYVMKITPFCVA